MVRRFTRVLGAAGVLLIVGLLTAASSLAQTPTPTPAPTPRPTTPAGAPGGASGTVGGTDVELTVYNSNLGLVKEVRTLALEEGANEVRFTDVAAGINATSVQVVSLTDPEGMTVLEQNYEYDIVGSRKLLSKYVDREVVLRTTQGETFTGTLLSASDDVILSTEEGIRLVRAAEIVEFQFPELPEGLITRPTLVWLLEAQEAGEQDVRVTYMTSGISWRADYVAMLSEDDAELALTGWVTVDNQSGATYPEARLKLVAGDVNRVRTAEGMYGAMDKGMPMPTAAPQVSERAFFEYHIYEVERPVTVKEAQTKQIEFVAAPQVAVDKVFVFESIPYRWGWYGSVMNDPGFGTTSDSKVQVRIEFDNSEDAGLGLPLPAGVVRVYKEDVGGGAEFVGEDAIDHTPRDESLSLTLGNAFDLVGERRQVRYRQISDRSAEETIEITLRNHKEEDVTIRAIEHLFRAQDAEIDEASQEFTLEDANTARFDVEVPADGEATVTYTVVYRW